MTDEIIIRIPDIGGATDVDVIEILVKEGDEVKEDTSLITLESDKASMEIPSPKAGKIGSIHLQVGDKVSEGDEILTLTSEVVGQDNVSESEHVSQDSEPELFDQEDTPSQPASESKIIEVTVPDIGGAGDVDVIEVLVQAGDSIKKDQSIITLESEKASMDIPSPYAGVVEAVAVKVGDKISEGSGILTLKSSDGIEPATKPVEKQGSAAHQASKELSESQSKPNEPDLDHRDNQAANNHGISSSVFAGPSVRRMARELGVELSLVRGSGRKSRITKEDVQKYVKAKMEEKSGPSGLAISPAPTIDFRKFGQIEAKPLNKIKRLTGENVHRSWVSIPHVTQFDEADITALEAFRKQEAEVAKKDGYKLTLLAFVCKVVANALKEFPQFNTSLDPAGKNLIFKHYFNIGVAVDTPNGLVVPVIKDVDRLSVREVAKEMGRLSEKAREKGLMPQDMSGGCFTISSLGGIGGTAFTPIVNSPEVAILGLSRSAMKPVYRNSQFEPRLMLPLSLSYDHRVIDGAEAARFTRFLSEHLADIRKIIL